LTSGNGSGIMIYNKEDYCSALPGPVSQVDRNCWTLGGFLENNPDSPIHQYGLSPNRNLNVKLNKLQST